MCLNRRGEKQAEPAAPSTGTAVSGKPTLSAAPAAPLPPPEQAAGASAATAGASAPVRVVGSEEYALLLRHHTHSGQLPLAYVANARACSERWGLPLSTGWDARRAVLARRVMSGVEHIASYLQVSAAASQYQRAAAALREDCNNYGVALLMLTLEQSQAAPASPGSNLTSLHASPTTTTAAAATTVAASNGAAPGSAPAQTQSKAPAPAPAPAVDEQLTAVYWLERAARLGSLTARNNLAVLALHYMPSPSVPSAAQALEALQQLAAPQPQPSAQPLSPPSQRGFAFGHAKGAGGGGSGYGARALRAAPNGNPFLSAAPAPQSTGAPAAGGGGGGGAPDRVVCPAAYVNLATALLYAKGTPNRTRDGTAGQAPTEME